MWNLVWCFSGLLPTRLVQIWELRPHRESVQAEEEGEILAMIQLWEEHSWVQSQWRRGRRMAQQDPWSATERLPLCESLISLLCHSSYLHISLFYRPGPGSCNTRHKGPLNSLEGTAIIWRRNCSHSDGENRALPVSNFPAEVPCHTKFWATAAAVLSTEKGDLSEVYF